MVPSWLDQKATRALPSFRIAVGNPVLLLVRKDSSCDGDSFHRGWYAFGTLE
ncbi:hypothetical protein RSSM_05343 [Rhodopirellula sallentina SM41]|uniref:Uncharacterized protein n=1 Tax=Rhodopirellula sallentina SM41 TaxID=1263870 RepID=M5TW30_9BACT|nr:hypothetical protein RSSM_05343 [Rhodopirellula sallentina SM41]